MKRLTDDDLRRIRKEIAYSVLRDFADNLWWDLWKRWDVEASQHDALAESDREEE